MKRLKFVLFYFFTSILFYSNANKPYLHFKIKPSDLWGKIQHMVYCREVIMHLKISGEVDAFDFLTMKNNIDSLAFEGCDSFRSLNIPIYVRTIERYAFDDVKADISFRKYNTHYSLRNDIFYNNNKTAIVFCLKRKKGDYIVPESVKVIGNRVFTACKQITSVTVHSGVEYIHDCAFSGYYSDIFISPENKRYDKRKDNQIFDNRVGRILECEKNGAIGKFYMFF